MTDEDIAAVALNDGRVFFETLETFDAPVAVEQAHEQRKEGDRLRA